jgi:hypothetical protein
VFSVLYSGICIVSRFSCVFCLFNIVFIKHFLVPPPFYAKYWNSWNFSMKSENRQYITRFKATNTCFEAKFPFLFFLFNLFFCWSVSKHVPHVLIILFCHAFWSTFRDALFSIMLDYHVVNRHPRVRMCTQRL